MKKKTKNILKRIMGGFLLVLGIYIVVLAATWGNYTFWEITRVFLIGIIVLALLIMGMSLLIVGDHINTEDFSNDYD